MFNWFKRRSQQKMWDILTDKPPTMEDLVDEGMKNGDSEKFQEMFKKIIEAKMKEFNENENR